MWTLEFAPGVNRDLSRIDRSHVRRINKFLQDRIQHLDSLRLIGSPLIGKALKNFGNTASMTNALSAIETMLSVLYKSSESSTEVKSFVKEKLVFS